MKKHKVEIPEGYEVDRIINTVPSNSIMEEQEDKITVYLRPIKKQLPKTWEEYNYNKHSGFIARYDGSVGIFNNIDNPDILSWPSKELALADRALRQLVRLRDHYNDGWEPDWTDYHNKYVLCIDRDCIVKTHMIEESYVLAFKTPDLRDDFLFNFRELIETAKPLL